MGHFAPHMAQRGASPVVFSLFSCYARACSISCAVSSSTTPFVQVKLQEDDDDDDDDDDDADEEPGVEAVVDAPGVPVPPPGVEAAARSSSAIARWSSVSRGIVFDFEIELMLFHFLLLFIICYLLFVICALVLLKAYSNFKFSF